MQLNKNHRESLLTELVKAKEEIDLATTVKNASNSEWHTEEFKD